MLDRLVTALIIIAVGLCGYMAVIHWDDDRHPLIIEAEFAPDPKGGPPLAIPDENALYSVCPTTPRNVPVVRRSIA